jgi:hypothetical protein
MLCTSEISNMRKTVVKYYLEEYFEMKIIDLEYWVLYVQLDFLMLSPIFFMKFGIQNSF